MAKAKRTDKAPRVGPAKGCRPLRGALLIACSRIRPDPRQVRRHADEAAQQELNASVKRLGILQPISVRCLDADKGYQIIVGHRRYQAACAAGLTEVPCWVQSPKEREVLVHQNVENWQRRDMHPYDLADALARLRDENGLSQREVARETGKSEGEISKLLRLLDLSPEVQKLAREDETGHVGRRHLYAVRDLAPDEQLRVIRQTQKDGLTATEVEEVAVNGSEGLAARQGHRSPSGRHRFDTAHGTVTVSVRKTDVTADDILAALDEARAQVGRPGEEAARPIPAV